jgi:hypothetical protein
VGGCNVAGAVRIASVAQPAHPAGKSARLALAACPQGAASPQGAAITAAVTIVQEVRMVRVVRVMRVVMSVCVLRLLKAVSVAMAMMTPKALEA